MAKPQPPTDEKARREARLAQALRANLRKRKTPTDKPAVPAESED